MLQRFNRLGIEVPHRADAEMEYQQLLGEMTNSTVRLSNIDVQIKQCSEITDARISSLGFGDDALGPQEQPAIENQSGLSLYREMALSPTPSTLTETGISAVDHLVIQSHDAEASISLFGEKGLGLRLALDQEVPEWGGRMLFFRFSKMTLEIIQDLKNPPVRSLFWGITYLCPDLEFTIAELERRKVQHSEIRQGRKPGTRVATVHSHNLGLPTLLIEPAS